MVSLRVRTFRLNRNRVIIVDQELFMRRGVCGCVCGRGLWQFCGEDFELKQKMCEQLQPQNVMVEG